MKSRLETTSLSVLVFLVLFVFSGCDRENIDDTTFQMPELPMADTILCSLGLEILIDSIDIDSSGLYLLMPIFIAEAVPPLTYEWSDSSSLGFLEIAPPANIELTVTDSRGCMESETVSF